jgi:hypothetical protein
MARALVLCLLIMFWVPALSVKAQQPRGGAARLVLIKPKEGMQKQFEEGYKRHLEWHRQNKDPWTWYGWQVVTGEHLGYFIDGTFGHAWEEFDRPVSPAEDAADNAINVTPYADFLFIGYYVLRPEVSRSNLLEKNTPSPFLELLYYQILPGREDDFEQVMRKVHEGSGRGGTSRRYAWYQLINGGNQTTYLLMRPLDKISQLQSAQQTIPQLLADAYPPKEARRLIGLLRAATRETYSETLRHRKDLSYFPARD